MAPADVRARCADRITRLAVAATDSRSLRLQAVEEPERTDLFARAFGLSSREREVLLHLTAGSDTPDIARQMLLTEHTPTPEPGS